MPTLPITSTARATLQHDNQLLANPQRLEDRRDPLADLSMGGAPSLGPTNREHPLAVFCRTRDAGDFRSFCDTAWRQCYAIALRIVRDHHLAEDVVQESFVKIFNSVDKIREEQLGPQGLDGWVHTIAKHTALDLYRAISRHKEPTVGTFGCIDDTVNGSALKSLPEPASNCVEPWEQLAMAETVELVQAAINELPDPHGSTLKAWMYGGVKYRESAEKDGVPIGTIKSRLYWARHSLEERLKSLVEL